MRLHPCDACQQQIVSEATHVCYGGAAPPVEQQLGMDFDAPEPPPTEDRSHDHHVMRVTSLEAYRELDSTGRSSQRSMDVLSAFMTHGEMTGQECTRKMREAGLMAAESWPVHPAIYSLRIKGFLTETTRRECEVTGRNAIAYLPTQHVDPQEVVLRVAKPSRVSLGAFLAEMKLLIHLRREADPTYERPEPSLEVEEWLIYMARPKGT